MSMSSRTKKIMRMVKQPSCDSVVDLVDYIVEEDGVLSPVNETLNFEVPLSVNEPNIISSNLELLSVDLNLDYAHTISNKSQNIIQISEIPEEATGCIANNMDALPDDSDISDSYQNHDSRDSLANGDNNMNVLPDSDVSDSYQNHDSGDSLANGDNDSEGRNESVSNSVLNNIKTRKKRRFVEGWNYNINKYKRSRGLPYQGKQKNEETWIYNVNRPGKYLPDPCHCALSKKSSTLQCQKMTEDKRLKVFQTFWNKMTWNERKVQVQALVQCENTKRRRGQECVSRRNYSMKYFLKVDLERIRVCKRMFGGTLGLKETMVLSWIKQGIHHNGDKDTKTNSGHQVSRKSDIKRAKFSEKNAAIHQFLNLLPKMESHYCRSTSKKKYLEPLWRSKAELYNFFKNNFCPENNLQAASIYSFTKIFEELNLSLFMPKKDLCDVCEAYKSKNLSEEEYNLHQTLKQEARQEKESDKSSGDLTVNVYAMDLQCVLLSPKSTVSAMYYKTKLIVHNFTIYNLKTKEGFCFLWNESEGRLTANEFSSIISFFVQQEISKSDGCLGEMIFFSDGCTGQNRNSTLANAFVNLAAQYNIIITQKYLLKGHTQMEVDSMHSSIERQVRNRKINLPADYAYHCQKARSSPSPYNVKYVTHTFFKLFDGLKFYSSIRPGRSVGDAVVTDIKALRYFPDFKIQYKLRHTDPWTILNQRLNKKISLCNFENLPPLYTERRKIKKEKYDHLQILKAGLLTDYQKFYDELPHE